MKLRVSLDNLLVAEQVGRWWIVGSSWSGAPMISEKQKAASQETPAGGQVRKIITLRPAANNRTAIVLLLKEHFHHLFYYHCSQIDFDVKI